ncbi:MAG: NUDIX hydrolase [Thermodesulfobacteriota bacterium]|jgi:8-oxo-dGTP pyrophosphatase MutT (NUDIX family)|nr:MAG: NUDIX hydrolase [Thermodesulfobacteriota bacterium]
MEKNQNAGILMPQKTIGPYQVLSTKTVYRNPWITVREDQVIHPGGNQGIFGVIEMKAGSTVLALNSKSEVFLIKEFKYGIARESIELMSGGLDSAESAIDGAKRELKEELGLEADKWINLGVVDPFTTIVRSPNYMFLAIGIKEGQQNLEELEKLEIIKIPFTQAIDMVMRSEITHSASCTCILKAARYLKIA